MKESREKFLDRYRAISSASAEASAAGDSAASPSNSAQKIDLTVSNEDIKLSVREVMRREWESLREEESGLPQLPSSNRASTEEYMEQVSNHVCTFRACECVSWP